MGSPSTARSGGVKTVQPLEAAIEALTTALREAGAPSATPQRKQTFSLWFMPRRWPWSMGRPWRVGGHLTALVAGFLIVSGASAQTDASCRPNIFGGQDCTHPDGRRSTSRPNIFDGYDTTFSDGTRWTSRANIFDGQDITIPEGTIRSRANIFGGQDYQLPDGGRVESRSNIFDGQDYRLPDGRRVVCRRNIFGGQDCR